MTNIRISLVDKRSGDHVGTVFSPVLPNSRSMTIYYGDGSVREFWVEDPGSLVDSVFHQDGPDGVIALTQVVIAVNETLDSRAGRGRGVGR